jgi:hypothetical protein
MSAMVTYLVVLIQFQISADSAVPRNETCRDAETWALNSERPFWRDHNTSVLLRSLHSQFDISHAETSRQLTHMTFQYSAMCPTFRSKLLPASSWAEIKKQTDNNGPNSFWFACCLILIRQFIVLIFHPWLWRQNIPPKHLLLNRENFIPTILSKIPVLFVELPKRTHRLRRTTAKLSWCEKRHERERERESAVVTCSLLLSSVDIPSSYFGAVSA